MSPNRCLCLFALVSMFHGFAAAAEQPIPPGFTSLFNGRDLSQWEIPQGDNGHWKVAEGVIDYDAQSEAKGDKNLWSKEEFGDFVLLISWRIKRTTGLYNMPIVLQDGSYLKDAKGQRITIPTPNADSGIYLRGSSRSQVNLWCWHVGSGEVYGYRNRDSNPTAIRSGVTPRINADRPVGEWNDMVIIMVQDRLTVMMNNQLIIENAQLPDVPERGKLALQHHGGKRDGKFSPASSLVQFRRIAIRKLD